MTDSLSIITLPSAQICCITAADDRDSIAAKLAMMEAIWQWAKDAKSAIEQSAIERLKEIGGSVRVGEICYWVGREKKDPKCVNIKATVEALMDATGGDFEKFCQHLSANAIKHGAAKKTLGPDEFARLFRQETVDKLQSGGEAEAAKAEQKLLSAPIAILEAKQ